MTYVKDTIAACATAPGKGGIGVIRISGPKVSDIAQSVLGSLPVERYATFTRFKDNSGSEIDHGLAIFFKAPNSFTGEDVLELQGHGGPVVVDMLLNRIVGEGARIANPGEFSQRAFLNDKLDLAQAEAIADLINSRTEAAAKGAMRTLKGEFSKKINTLVALVIELRVFVEGAIDFPEEEIDFLSDDIVESQLGEISEQLYSILQRAGKGVLLTEGASVAIVGKPNAGKSSLMNALTGQETSIVTNIPGTTRDLVDESLQVGGIPLRIVDTAGLRDSPGEIEAEGVKRALAASEQADLVLMVIDASCGIESAKKDEQELAVSLKDDGYILVLNKCDLVTQKLTIPGIQLSAKTGEGMPDLESELQHQLGYEADPASNFTARARHLRVLRLAIEAVDRGKTELAGSRAGELLAEELRTAQHLLSEITGEFSADDLLGEIFSSFCIGK